MRLKPEKIEHLAHRIYESLEAQPQVELQETRDHVLHLIIRVITEDMKQEDEIEEQARRMLQAHRGEIDLKGMSFDKLLQKAKHRIAQERKIVI